MSNHMMWFGNRNYMQWVKCPEVSADYGSQGSQHSAQYLNGGAFNRQTLSAAKDFRLTWSRTSADEIRKITDYIEGVYGPGLIYWSDPATQKVNVLPQSLATPSLGGYDGVILDGTDNRPSLIPTGRAGLPYESAVYELNFPAGEGGRVFSFPIPPGYGFLLEYYGTTGGTAALAVDIDKTGWTPLMSESAYGVQGSGLPATVDGGHWIDLRLQGAGAITLSGIVLKILPDLDLPAALPLLTWASGQGNSGVDFDGYPTKEVYSAAFDMVGLTAKFVETGQWQ